MFRRSCANKRDSCCESTSEKFKVFATLKQILLSQQSIPRPFFSLLQSETERFQQVSRIPRETSPNTSEKKETQTKG